MTEYTDEQIDELLTEVEIANEMVYEGDLCDLISRLGPVLDALRHQRDEALADARRYRWLKTEAAWYPHDWYVGPEPDPGVPVEMENYSNHAVEGIDEAIDAAIEQESSGG